MQTFNNIANGEPGLSVRGKLNKVITSIISGSEGINAIWTKINSVIQMVNAMEGGIGGLVKDTSYDPSSLDTYKSVVLISLCTGTFYRLTDKNGTPITIPGNNALTIFYRSANTSYWEYDTHEIFPAVDSYEDTDYTKIESADTHVLTNGGNAIKPMTDFDSVYDAEGNNLTKTFEKLYAGIRGVISYKILDSVFASGLYIVSYNESDTDEYSIGVLEVFYDSMKHILYHVIFTNCSNPNESYIVHSDFELPKKWIRRFNLSSSIDIGIPIGSWGSWELIENLTPELLEKLKGIEEYISDISDIDKRVEALENNARITLSVSPSVIHRNVTTSITIRANAYGFVPDSFSIIYNGQEIASNEGKTSVTATIDASSSVTLSAKAIYGGRNYTASASVKAVGVIYYGFMNETENVTKTLSPRTSALGNYQLVSTLDNAKFFIMIPHDMSFPSSITMGGTPYVMDMTETERDGERYYMLTSGATYNVGAEININLS